MAYDRDVKGEVRKPYLPGKKLLKTTALGQPDTWVANGLIGCYRLRLTLMRTADGISIEGYDVVTKVKVKDLMIEQDGKLAGELFYCNKNREGDVYINLVIEDQEEMTGAIL